MKKSKRSPATTPSSFHLVVVRFLFLCFLATSINLSSICHEVNGDAAEKSSHGWAKRDNQMPYEEKEKDLETKTDDRGAADALLLALIRESAQEPFFYLSDIHAIAFSNVLLLPVAQPIYLTKRTLLI